MRFGIFLKALRLNLGLDSELARLSTYGAQEIYHKSGLGKLWGQLCLKYVSGDTLPREASKAEGLAIVGFAFLTIGLAVLMRASYCFRRRLG